MLRSTGALAGVSKASMIHGRTMDEPHLPSRHLDNLGAQRKGIEGWARADHRDEDRSRPENAIIARFKESEKCGLYSGSPSSGWPSTSTSRAASFGLPSASSPSPGRSSGRISRAFSELLAG